MNRVSGVGESDAKSPQSSVSSSSREVKTDGKCLWEAIHLQGILAIECHSPYWSVAFHGRILHVQPVLGDYREL